MLDAAGTGVAEIGYGDDGVAEQAAAPTNAVALLQFLRLPAAGTGTLDVLIMIPAGKYPYWKTGGFGANLVILVGFMY